MVVFHSAVLVYLAADQRQAFAEQMLALDDVTWVSNEGSGVFPFSTDQVEKPVAGRTILAVDGKPVALVGPTVRATNPSNNHHPFRPSAARPTPAPTSRSTHPST